MCMPDLMPMPGVDASAWCQQTPTAHVAGNRYHIASDGVYSTSGHCVTPTLFLRVGTPELRVTRESSLP